MIFIFFLIFLILDPGSLSWEMHPFCSPATESAQHVPGPPLKSFEHQDIEPYCGGQAQG